MPTIEVVLPSRHPAQQRIVEESRRFNVVDCGRRFGKTTLGIDQLATDETLVYPCAWFSPTYKMLTEVWREAERIFKPIISRRNAQERRLEFLTGGLLEFWSLDRPEVARGRKYRRLIVDEAALVVELLNIWQYVLRPTLIDYAGDAWFLSTPKGRNGFYTMFQWGQDAHLESWISWQMPSMANPHIPPSELEDMRRTMPERVYQQEVMANFLDDAGGVFRRVIEAATAQEKERPELGHAYLVGVDWAKHSDFTVLTVLDVSTASVVYIDRFNQVDYEVQVGRLLALCERFRPGAVIAERNSMGDPLIEHLQRRGLPMVPFTTTNASKQAAVDNLALAFERGSISILNDPVLIAELQSYEMERTPSGMLRYSAPKGMHDDCVMSLMIAWEGMTELGRPGDQVVVHHEPVTISPY